jgi:hypothetical protein
LITAGTLSGAAQVLEASGQSLFQLRASREWNEAHTLVGVSPPEDPTATAPPAASALSAAERQRRLMYWLLGTGVALVVLAEPIAKLLVPGFRVGDSWGWDAQQLAEWASLVRLLGLMSFAAGLVERLALAIRPRS